jgi:hypothetical protein
MALQYSIVESLFDDQEKCTGKLTCSKHGHQDYSHNMKSSKVWLRDNLSKYITDPATLEDYFQICWEVRENIRHGTVHSAAMSTASYFMPEPGNTEWDIESTIKEYGKDFRGLMSIMLNFSHIVRNLLLNEVLNTPCNHNLPILKSSTVSL